MPRGWSLSLIHISKLTAYYSEKYARDSIVIAVAGNFDEERIAELFESRLTSLREKKVTQDFTLKPYRPVSYTHLDVYKRQ